VKGQRLYFNGLNGATGAPLFTAGSADDLVEWIKGGDKNEDKTVIDTLATVREKRIEAKRRGVLGLIEGKDALDLKQARWGVIYHPNTPEEVRNHLAPLIADRGGNQYTYEPGEKSRKFRARHKQGPGAVDPDKLAYYLLIVGSPDEIPFKFQYGLDAEHAVGRIYFDDAADYGRYVQNVLAYESTTTSLSRERRVAVFSPMNPDDEATALSASELAGPLANALHNRSLDLIAGGQAKYHTEQITGAAATRPALLDLLTRSTNRPALIFAAAHGLGFPNGHLRQARHQGAIVCQEWPGPVAWPENQEVPETMYMAGDHLPANASFDGLIVFSFACYSAGTPHYDDFSYFKHQQPEELAPNPFVAHLPQRLLAQGALAFIGHVERAWDYSFLSQGVGQDITTFKSTIEAILKGKPIGHAFEYFNDRYTDLAHDLTESNEESLLSQYNLGEIDAQDLVSTWMAHNDARAYVVFGDPWVSLKPSLMPEV
jgi:hypothetical protein